VCYLLLLKVELEARENGVYYTFLLHAETLSLSVRFYLLAIVQSPKTEQLQAFIKSRLSFEEGLTFSRRQSTTVVVC